MVKGVYRNVSKTDKKIVLNKGVYKDKELNSLKVTETRVQIMDSREDVLRTNKLDNVTKVVISLNELNNSDNLEDGKPSDAIFTYYVTSSEYSTRFEPVTPNIRNLRMA